MSRKFLQKSQQTKIIKAKLKKNDYTSNGFSLLNYVLTISSVSGTSDHLEVLFSKCPKNIVGHCMHNILHEIFSIYLRDFLRIVILYIFKGFLRIVILYIFKGFFTYTFYVYFVGYQDSQEKLPRFSLCGSRQITHNCAQPTGFGSIYIVIYKYTCIFGHWSNK